MDLSKFGSTAVTLIEHEQVIFSIGMTDSSHLLTSKRPEVLLLTNNQLMYIGGTGNDQRTVIATVDDVESVEITSNPRGYSAYLWAGLAGLISIVLFSSIDNTVVKLAATALVLLMGVYLIIDQLTRPRKPSVVFRTCNVAIRWEFDSTDATGDIYKLIKWLYRIKRGGISPSNSPANFAPR